MVLFTDTDSWVTTEQQKSRWLTKLVFVELVSAIAMTEPGCGSDLKAVATHAKRDAEKLCNKRL